MAYVLQEPVQLGVVLRIVGSEEQWQEQVVDQLLKVVDQLVRTVNVTETRINNTKLGYCCKLKYLIFN